MLNESEHERVRRCHFCRAVRAVEKYAFFSRKKMSKTRPVRRIDNRPTRHRSEMQKEARDVWAANPDLLCAVDDDEDHDKFVRALGLAFDVSPELMERIANRDHLWFPTRWKDDGAASPNYFQVASRDTMEREPILSMHSYLFERSEPYYAEPYDFDRKEKRLLRAFHKRRNEKYPTKRDYLNRVAAVLFLDADGLGVE